MNQTLYQRVLKYLIEELKKTNPSSQEERKVFANYLYGNPHLFGEIFHKKNENFTELVKPYKDELPAILENFTGDPWVDLTNLSFVKLDVTSEKELAEYITEALIDRFADIVQFEYFHGTILDLIDYIVLDDPVQIFDID